MNNIQKLCAAFVVAGFSTAPVFSKTQSATNDTVVADCRVEKTPGVMTPEKIYLLTTFLDKGYPLSVYRTRDALPFILKTEQQKQQYFGDSGMGVSSLYSGNWVQARDLEELSRALCDYSLKSYQDRKKSGWYEWKPPFDPKELEDSFLEDSKQTLLTAIDVWRLPLSLTPPRYIVRDNFKRLGVFDYLYTTYPLATLGALSKAVDGLTISNPQLATPAKTRLRNIRQIQSSYAKEYLKFIGVKGWRVTMKENAQTAAFAKSYQQENRILSHELGLLKLDINKMFVELKKKQNAPKP